MAWAWLSWNLKLYSAAVSASLWAVLNWKCISKKEQNSDSETVAYFRQPLWGHKLQKYGRWLNMIFDHHTHAEGKGLVLWNWAANRLYISGTETMQVSESRSVVSNYLCPPWIVVHGILQVRILEWVALTLSRGSSQPRDRTQVSCIAGGLFTSWTIREAQRRLTMGLICGYCWRLQRHHKECDLFPLNSMQMGLVIPRQWCLTAVELLCSTFQKICSFNQWIDILTLLVSSLSCYRHL